MGGLMIVSHTGGMQSTFQLIIRIFLVGGNCSQFRQ